MYIQSIKEQGNYYAGASHLINYPDNRHQLISVIDLAEDRGTIDSHTLLKQYCILLSGADEAVRRLIFISPGKFSSVLGCQQALVFHPELIRGTLLANCFADFSVFNSSKSNMLNLSLREYELTISCFSNIKMELNYSSDKHSRKLILSNLELFLNYCERSFSGNVIEQATQPGILSQFDKLLSRYFISENPFTYGIPSVAYFADRMNLSTKYFGSLIKKESGKTVQDYIRDSIIEEAKQRILSSQQTINEIACDLGFKYPQHFCRFFKKVIGSTPNEFRISCSQ